MGLMPKFKRPFVASPDQVRISREGDTAFIDFADPDVGGVHLKIGPEIESMTDEEILELHNDVIRSQQALADQYEHVAVEVPVGSPQIRHFERGDQWVPRGGVLRCVISDGGPGFEATVCIDDKELSLAEFGRMLLTYNGWGMRITFVPDDEIHERPAVEIKEPVDPEEPPEGL